MPNVRDILNEIKWTKNFKKVKIWYIHRGALNNTKIILFEYPAACCGWDGTTAERR